MVLKFHRAKKGRLIEKRLRNTILEVSILV